MPDILYHMLCGLTAGLLGGYLGLGGGEVIVPILTVILGHDIKTAVPVSVAAVVVNAFSSSIEYLRRGMVDLELTIILGIFMVMGNITGSTLNVAVSENLVRLLLTGLLVYTALTLLRGRMPAEELIFVDDRRRYMALAVALCFLIGTLAGMVGVGGGVLLMPLLYLLIKTPLATSRGTTAMIIVFASASAAAVYLLRGAVEYTIVAPVVVGVLIGGKIGGRLGTVAKPIVVRLVFFVVMIYLAWQLAANPVSELF